MTPELRDALLKLKGMPTNENGDPPTGFTEAWRDYTNAYEFALTEDGKVVIQGLIFLDGFNMNPDKETWGRTYNYEEPS